MGQRGTVSIGPPFGGLVTSPSTRAVGLRDCTDCLNVHTTNGSIEVRRGITKFTSDPLDPALTAMNPILKLKYGLVSGERILFAWGPVTSGGSSLLLIDNTGQVVASKSMSSSTNRPVISIFNGRAYVANQSDSVVVYKSGGTWQFDPIGIARSTSAPTIDSLSGSSGIPAGAHSYIQTFYNSKSGVESGASPFSDPSLAAHAAPIQQVDLTLIPSNDPQVDKVRIYRRDYDVNINPLDDTWYRIAEVNHGPGFGYTDNLGSIPVQNKTPDNAVPTFADKPPSDIHVCGPYRDFMLWSNASKADRVLVSEPLFPEIVNPENAFGIGSGDGTGIIAIKQSFGFAFIFKETSIWILTGTDPSNMVVSQLDSQVGCIAPDTVVQIEDSIYFVGQRGLYRINITRRRVEYLSAHIEKTWREFTLNTRFNMSATWDTVHDVYLLTGQTSTGKFDLQLAYNYKTGDFFKWKLDASAIESFPRSFGDQGDPYLAMDTTDPNTDGHIAFLDVSAVQDFGPQSPPNLNIPFSWQMPESDFGTTKRKRFYSIWLNFEKQTSNFIFINVRAAIDDKTKHQFLGVIQGPALKQVPDLGEPFARAMPIRNRGQAASILLDGLGGLMELSRIDLDIEPVETVA